MHIVLLIVNQSFMVPIQVECVQLIKVTFVECLATHLWTSTAFVFGTDLCLIMVHFFGPGGSFHFSCSPENDILGGIDFENPQESPVTEVSSKNSVTLNLVSVLS
jgi:hypothetical protein